MNYGRIHKWAYELKSEIYLVLEMRRILFPQIYDGNWICDFLFCIERKNELYISFQQATYLTLK
jgi:hypothetical protein